jgi:hypothetical protein
MSCPESPNEHENSPDRLLNHAMKKEKLDENSYQIAEAIKEHGNEVVEIEDQVEEESQENQERKTVIDIEKWETKDAMLQTDRKTDSNSDSVVAPARKENPLATNGHAKKKKKKRKAASVSANGDVTTDVPSSSSSSPSTFAPVPPSKKNKMGSPLAKVEVQTYSQPVFSNFILVTLVATDGKSLRYMVDVSQIHDTNLILVFQYPDSIHDQEENKSLPSEWDKLYKFISRKPAEKKAMFSRSKPNASLTRTMIPPSIMDPLLAKAKAERTSK